LHDDAVFGVNPIFNEKRNFLFAKNVGYFCLISFCALIKFYTIIIFIKFYNIIKFNILSYNIIKKVHTNLIIFLKYFK